MNVMSRYLLILMVMVSFLACSEEEWPDNSQPEQNFFGVPEEATGEEAEMRRAFFDNTGIYLLFTDTLGVIENVSMSGEVVEEYKLLDLLYTMGPASTAPDSLEFIYYNSLQAKREAVNFLQNEVLPDVSELFYPFSILLLEQVVHFENFVGLWYNRYEVVVFSGLQGAAMGLRNVAELSEDEKLELKNEVIKGLVINNITKIPDEEFVTFYSFSEGYYDTYSWNLPSPVYLSGFLESVSFYTHDDDKLAYVEKIYELSEDEFRETYADYQIVINKMEEMVRILQKYGVSIYE